MTEAIIWIVDDHAGYTAGSGCYFSPATGVIPLPHPDCIEALNMVRRAEGRSELVNIRSSAEAPWVTRFEQISIQGSSLEYRYHGEYLAYLQAINGKTVDVDEAKIAKDILGGINLKPADIAKAVNDEMYSRMKA